MASPPVAASSEFSETTVSPGCVTAKYGSDNHAEILQVGNRFHLRLPILDLDFAQIDGAALRRNRPKNVSEVFEAKLGCLFKTFELRVDFDSVAFIFHFGFARGLLHQVRAVKEDF